MRTLASSRLPILSLVVITAACGTDGGSPTRPPTTSVASVGVSGAPFLSAGSTSQLSAAASLADGTAQDVATNATWQSSNATVATVSARGLVTALVPGTARITATYQGKVGSFGVLVSPGVASIGGGNVCGAGGTLLTCASVAASTLLRYAIPFTRL